jgi:sortase A
MQRKWLSIVGTVVAAGMLSAGAYVLLVLWAPSSNVPLLTGRASDETAKKLSQPAGANGDRLYIPQINVDVAIVTGNDSSALERGAWHRVPQNGDPVRGGNFVLSAHRFVMSFTPQGTAVKSPFYNIDKLVTGDQISVDFGGKRYVYVVTKKYAVKPTDITIESPSKKAKLTLYSCTLQGSLDGRDVIEAEPIL